MKRCIHVISALIALILIAASFPLDILALDTITILNINKETATVTRTSTLYVGEVIVNGESKFKYLYSGDITNSETVFGAVKYALGGMEDTSFSDLMPDITGESDDKGIAECSVPENKSEMDGNWKDAAYAGNKYYPGHTVADSQNVNLYDADSAFAARCVFEEKADIVGRDGQPYELRSPLGKLTAVNTDSVTYTVENGQLVKYIDRDVDYTCEAVDVVYTKVYLKNQTNVVTKITSRETLKKESDVYIGEIFVKSNDSSIKKMTYIYSSGITFSQTVLDSLRNTIADDEIKALLPETAPGSPATGMKFSSDHTDEMTDDWKDARKVAEKYFDGVYTPTGIDLADGTHTDDHTVFLYDHAYGNRVFFDTERQKALTTITDPVDPQKGIVSHIGSTSVDVVYYTIVDGQIVKNVETVITYECERTNIYYTKATLTESLPVETLIKGDVDFNGKADSTDYIIVKRHILKIQTLAGNGFTAGDMDSNGVIDSTDVILLKKKILGI